MTPLVALLCANILWNEYILCIFLDWFMEYFFLYIIFYIGLYNAYFL